MYLVAGVLTSPMPNYFSLLAPVDNAISKTLLYHCKDLEKPRVLLFGPRGISVVNIGGTTIHSSLSVKPEIRLLGLNAKSKTA